MKEPLAYKAMFEFLDERFRKLPSDALGALLGELQLASDGEPFDPAVAEEWDHAVTTVEQQSRFTSRTERQRRVS